MKQQLKKVGKVLGILMMLAGFANFANAADVDVYPVYQVIQSHDGTPDPDDNLAMLVGLYGIKRNMEANPGRVEMAGFVYADTSTYKKRSMFISGRKEYGNYHYFLQYGKPAMQEIYGSNVFDCATQTWNFNATSNSQLTTGGQFVYNKVKAAMENTDTTKTYRVVYTAGGGLNAAWEAISLLLKKGKTPQDIKDHFLIVQHSDWNLDSLNDPGVLAGTLPYYHKIIDQNPYSGRGKNPPSDTVSVSRTSQKFFDAYWVAYGPDGTLGTKDIPNIPGFHTTTDSSDSGSHRYASTPSLLDANWAIRYNYNPISNTGSQISFTSWTTAAITDAICGTDDSPTYQLTVNNGSGDGSYQQNSVVLIVADNGAVNQVFDKWTGDTANVANVNAASTTVTMPAANVAVTATYKTVQTYALTVNNGSGDGNYPAGQNVTISANAAPAGQVFDKWTGATANLANVNAASTTVTMPAANVAVTATYKVSTTINYNPIEDAYLQGATRYNNENLKVEPNYRVSYLKFDVAGLSGAVEKATLKLKEAGDTGTGTLRFYKGSHNNWTEDNLSTSNAPATSTQIAVRSGSVSTGQSIDIDISSLITGNGTYTLIIKMDTGGNDIWFGSKESSASPQLVIETGEVTPTKYALTVNSGSGDGSYTAGTVVNISANAAPAGKEFDKWTGDVANVANASSANTSVTMPAAAVSVTATYKDLPPVTYSLTVNSGSGDGTYEEGTVVNINANAAPAGQEFDKWTGDVANVANANLANTSVTMPAANVAVSATYKDLPVVTLRDPDMPNGTVAGLKYEYYTGTWNLLPDFDALTPVTTGNIDQVDVSVKETEEYYGIRYTGYVVVPEDGEYTFYTNSDDGSQLFIGDEMIVDNDGLHGMRERSGTIGLKAGGHAITVTFFEKTIGDNIIVSYAGPGIAKQVIPASAYQRVDDSQPPVDQLIDANFDSDAEGFVYLDDTFRNTNAPNYADGSYDTANGAIKVTLGGQDDATVNGMSGAWVNTFTLAKESEVMLVLNYRLLTQKGYEPDEFGEALVAIDGQLLGENNNDYLVQIYDGGDSGWQTFTATMTLPAGQHVIELGAYNNKKTYFTEVTEVWFDDVSVSAVGQGTEETVFAVNCGGGAYTAEDGTEYVADVNYIGGKTYTKTGTAIENTEDDTLYQSERYGDISYNVPVENGVYEVTIKMAEVYWHAIGKRQFDVMIEDQELITDLDLFQQVGNFVAHDRTFTVNVDDGELNIDFLSDIDNAKVSAIKITK